MDAQLNEIISRIEASTLSTQEKAQLYTAISGGLQASVWPVLIKYAPKGEIDGILEETDEKKKVERYGTLINKVTDREDVIAEMEETMNGLLSEVDAALKEEQI